MGALQASAQSQLRQFIEQLETLDQERKDTVEAIRDKLSEAKAVGFDVKAIKKILRLRKQSAAEREEEEAILATYLGALGMLADLPLGQAAVERDFGARV